MFVLRSCRSVVYMLCGVFFFKQKTAYEMRISDWSSDVCSSDLREVELLVGGAKVSEQIKHLIHDPVRTCARTVDLVDNDNRVQALLKGFLRHETGDRKSVVSGKRVAVRVDLGCRRCIQKKKK